MSTKLIASNLLVELSTQEQQLLSGGQTTGQPSPNEQPLFDMGQLLSPSSPSSPSDGYRYRRDPIYICRPVYNYDGGREDNR